MCLQKWYSTDSYLTGYTTSFVCAQYSMGISLRLTAEFRFLTHNNSLGFQCCGDVVTINKVLILSWILHLILSSFWRIFSVLDETLTWKSFLSWWIFSPGKKKKNNPHNKLMKRKCCNFPSFTVGIQRLYTIAVTFTSLKHLQLE